jgi:hypothetical protein
VGVKELDEKKRQAEERTAQNKRDAVAKLIRDKQDGARLWTAAIENQGLFSPDDQVSGACATCKIRVPGQRKCFNQVATKNIFLILGNTLPKGQAAQHSMLLDLLAQQAESS